MSKIITLKYAGTCRACGARLPRGEKAIWTGRGRVMCVSCDDINQVTGERIRVSHCYSPVTGNSWTSCNCEDYPCCGH